jgi:putative transposase
VADPVSASGLATPDLIAFALLEASRLPIAVLRGPLEPGQYLSIRYTERLAETGAVCSVGSRGDSYDNALAEAVNGLYKVEVIRKSGPWRSLEHVELATAEWVDWWNNHRLHGAIGNVPPAEFEALYHAQRTAAQAA